MLTSIFQWFATALSKALESLVNAFLNGLDLNLSEYLRIFPLLSTVYSLLQSLAVGLIVIIAGRKLAMFWLGAVDSSEMQDRPVNILVRSFIAAIGVFMGGYVLEFMVKLGTIPFNMFKDSVGADHNVLAGFGEALIGGVGSLFGSVADGANTGSTTGSHVAGAVASGLADLPVALISFFFLILIAWNLFKLAIEVCERYMMVGLLVFTSPIIYPTLSTKDTTQIFKRWWSMFVGALIMMSASVIFLKLIINGLAHVQSTIGETVQAGNKANFLIRMLIVLATCKIAQRVDSYLQQLGLSVATTGGNMLDDLVAAAGTIGRTLGGHLGGASKSAILGGANNARTPLGHAGNAYAAEMYRSKDPKKAAAAAKQEFKSKMASSTGIGGAVSGASKAAKAANLPKVDLSSKNAGQQLANRAKAMAQAAPGIAKAGAKGFVTGAALGASNLLFPRTTNAMRGDLSPAETAARDDKIKKAEELKAEKSKTEMARGAGEAQRAGDSMAKKYHEGSGTLPEDMAKRAEKGDKILPSEAKANLENYGLRNEQGKVLEHKDDIGGDLDMNTKGKAAGLSIDHDKDGKSFVSGSEKAVGMAANAMGTEAYAIPRQANGEDLTAGERASLFSDKRSLVENTSDKMGSEAAEAAVLSGRARAGTAEDMLPGKFAPQGDKETDAAYQGRARSYMATVDAAAASGADMTAYRDYQKAFGDRLPAPARSWQGVDVPTGTNEHGNPVPAHRRHYATYEGSDGMMHTRELIDDRAYKAMSESERAAYTGFMTAAGTTMYERDYIGGSERTNSAEARRSAAAAYARDPEAVESYLKTPSFVSKGSETPYAGAYRAAMAEQYFAQMVPPNAQVTDFSARECSAKDPGAIKYQLQYMTSDGELGQVEFFNEEGWRAQKRGGDHSTFTSANGTTYHIPDGETHSYQGSTAAAQAETRAYEDHLRAPEHIENEVLHGGGYSYSRPTAETPPRDAENFYRAEQTFAPLVRDNARILGVEASASPTADGSVPAFTIKVQDLNGLVSAKELLTDETYQALSHELKEAGRFGEFTTVTGEKYWVKDEPGTFGAAIRKVISKRKATNFESGLFGR